MSESSSPIATRRSHARLWRRAVAWPCFWVFFGMGDLTARIVYRWPQGKDSGWTEVSAQPVVEFYSWCMRQSLRVNDWGGLKYWSEPS